MIPTSNRGFAKWGDVFGDPVAATALLDRLPHHTVVIQVEGASYRLRRHVDLVPEHVRANAPITLPDPPKKTGDTRQDLNLARHQNPEVGNSHLALLGIFTLALIAPGFRDQSPPPRGRGRRETPPSGGARPFSRRPCRWRRRGPLEGGRFRATCSRVSGSPRGRASWAKASACHPAPVSAASRQRTGRHGMVGRIDIQAHDVADLDLEPRIPGHLERLHLVRSETVLLQDAVHGGHGYPHLLRQRHTARFDMPVRRTVSIRPCPEPSSRTMRARQTCF